MHKFTLVILFLGMYLSTVCQTITLSGVILDEHDIPLEGVTVMLSPGGIVAYSNVAGSFRIPGLQEGRYTITFTHVGYSRQEVSVHTSRVNSPLHIHLQPSVGLLDEVVISADQEELRKKEESLTIETVSSSFIRRNLGGSLMQSMERLPGITILSIGSGQSKPLIRGLGFNRVVVVDKGIKHEGQQWGADHGLEIDQFAVDKAEVIKGAASFVYGSDAIGGAIDIRPGSLPPVQSLGGSVDIVGKSNNLLYGTSANLFGRNDAWFFDARLTHQDYADYRIPTGRVHVYDYPVDLYKNHLRNSAGNETNMHLSAGFVRDSVRSTFYVSNIHSNSGFFANAHGLEPRRVDTGLHDRSRRDILKPNQRVNHFKIINRSAFHFAGHLLEAEVGYQHNFRQEFNQYVNHGYMPPVYPDDMSVPRDLEREFDKHVYTANVRDYLWIGRHGLTAGFNVEHQDNAINGWSFLIPAFRQTTAGAFAYDKFQLTDRVLLHGAVRYDFGQIKMFRYTDWFTSDTEVDGEPVSIYVERASNLLRRFNSLVWSGGMNYSNGKLDLKANIGKSFRIPIAKELGANGVNYHYFSYERGDIDLKPEQSYQTDIGLTWTERKWVLSVTPFFNYFTNYIYLNPTPEHDYFYGAGNQVFQYAQSEVMRHGGEVQIEWNFHRDISLEVLGEYLYARQRSGAKKGYTLPFSPPPSILVNLTWSPKLRSEFHDTFFSIDYRITARQHNIVPPEKKTPGYQVINVQTGATVYVSDHPMTISLQVQNLLDANYMKHTSFYRLIGLPEAGQNIILNLNIPFTINTNKP